MDPGLISGWALDERSWQMQTGPHGSGCQPSRQAIADPSIVLRSVDFIGGAPAAPLHTPPLSNSVRRLAAQGSPAGPCT